MYEAKTKPTRVSLTSYLDTIADAERRKDCKALATLMTRVTGCAPTMWGTSIVGFAARAVSEAAIRRVHGRHGVRAACPRDVTHGSSSSRPLAPQTAPFRASLASSAISLR
jgi:hypothetical protein